MSNVEVLNDPTLDDDVQTLLEAIAETNPDADHVSRTVYYGEPLDIVTVLGTSNADITLPEVDGFELETLTPPEIEDKELEERLFEDGKIPEGYGDETVGPAHIRFEKV